MWLIFLPVTYNIPSVHIPDRQRARLGELRGVLKDMSRFRLELLFTLEEG